MDIFQLLDSRFEFKEKIKNLSKLFLEKNYFANNGYYVSFDEYFDINYFRKWKYSYGCYTLEDFKSKLGLQYTNDFMNQNDKYFYPNDESSAINFLQYAYNAVNFVKESIQRNSSTNSDIDEFYEIFTNQFNYILSKINQKLIKRPNEDYYLLIPNDNKTTRCAKIQNNYSTAFLLYEYTSSLLAGNIEKKREILKLLANEIEPIITSGLRKFNSGTIHDIFSELSSCLNNFNIRHNNVDARKPNYFHKEIQTFSNDDYEEIYDATYDLILDAFLLDEYLNKTKETYIKYKKKAML